ncbi:Gp49 family protein [Aggregatibacter segnis]|uniref:Gp49 family protein n=1 Tax=Aggregatibacter segnis TaxID=739 RepID=UPI000D650D9F|nr:Gp49 family protein [Aggregatibacter segnis]
MNKLTIEYLTELVDDVEYVHQGLLTICTITLKNGYKLAGTSVCVDNQNYDPLIRPNRFLKAYQFNKTALHLL